jgi:endonuclease/exonuclease/phosphatase family metal-dependent hydrolase
MRGASFLLALVMVVLPWTGRAKTSTPILLNRPLCGSVAGDADAGDKAVLRVATFNVLHGLEETPDYPTHSTLDDRVGLAAHAIADARIDLIGMQEVSKTLGAVGHQPGLVASRIAEQLAQITGESWHWCWALSNPHFPIEPDMRVGGGGPASDVMASMASDNYASFKEGSAVLSRYPILNAEMRRLPLRFPGEYVACPPKDVPVCNETAIFDHRIALWARVATPHGASDVIATHLAHDITALSDVSAFEQAAALIGLSREMDLRHGTPARHFITCDCNVTTEDVPPVVKLITTAGWSDTYADVNPTSKCTPPTDVSACTSDQDILAPVSTVDERIDYVFARPGSCELDLGASEKFANTPGSSATHPFLWASDHQGVWLDMNVAGCATGIRPV